MKRPNIYASGGIDRAALLRGDAAWVESRLADPATRLVPVWRSRNLIDMEDGPSPRLLPPDPALVEEAQAVALLGLVEGVAHFAIDLSHRAEEEAARIGLFEDLRKIGPLLSHGDGALMAYARGMMHWHLAHRFAGAAAMPPCRATPATYAIARTRRAPRRSSRAPTRRSSC